MDIVLLSPPLYQEWICRCMAGAKSRRIMIFWFNMDREIIAAVSENFPHPGWRGKLHASAEGAKERTGRCKPSYALTDFGALSCTRRRTRRTGRGYLDLVGGIEKRGQQHRRLLQNRRSQFECLILHSKLPPDCCHGIKPGDGFEESGNGGCADLPDPRDPHLIRYILPFPLFPL